MALSATLVGSSSSTTSGVTLAVTTTASIPANATILLAIAADNSATGGASNLVAPSVPSGVVNANTGVNSPWSTFTRTPGGVANDGAVIGVWVYNNGASTLASGATFTFNFGSTTSKAAQVWYVSSSNSASYANKVTSVGNTGSGTSPTVTASITNNHLAIGFLAHESNSAAPVADSDTTNGTWSSATQTTANSGTSTTSMILYSQNKVVTATGSQTWNQSSFTSSDYANLLASFQEVTITTGSGSPTLGAATGSASASPVAVASGTPSLANATASASGLVIDTVSASGSPSLADATGAAQGSPVASVSGSSSLSDATGAATGTPVVTSSGTPTLADATGDAAGITAAQLSGTATLSGATATATGSPVVSTSGTGSLGDATGSATGTPVVSGSAAPALVDATSSAAGNVVFSPSQLAPILWLDASDTATITQSANSVSSWLDKSTNAWTFTQTTASAKPTTNTRTINGKNVLDFDGTDVLLGSGTTANWKFLHDGTVYLVAAVIVVDSPNTTARPILATGTTANPNSAQIYADSTSGWITTRVRNATTSIIFNPTGTIGYRTDKTLLLGINVSPAIPYAVSYVDNYAGTTDGSFGGTPSTANATFALRIGGYGTTSGTFNGAIAEIVIVTGANATEANWFTIRDYLSAKWGGSTVIDTSWDTLFGGFSGTAGHYSDLLFTAVQGTVTSSYTATAVTGDITITGVSPTIEQGAVLSGSPSLANATGSAAGTSTITGAGTSTLADATSSVVGSPVAVASGTPALAAATGAATGRVVASGSASPTLVDATSSAAGTPTAIGSTATTLGAATSSAAGTTTILSSGTSTLGAATASGTAVAGSNTFVLATLADATASATAVVIATGTGSPTLGAVTGTAVGTPIAQSSGAVTLGVAVGACQAQVIAVSSAAVTLGAAAGAAQGQIIAAGSGAVALSPATGSATGSPIRTASGAATLQNATAIGLQSFPQTITTGVGTMPMTGLAGTSNIATFVFTGGVQTTRGVITFTAVSGKTQQGVITLSGSHNAPQPGPISATGAVSDFTITGNSTTPTEGFLAQTGVFVISGPGTLPVITKHVAYWDGTQWKIGRFKEWTGSGWAESDRVKANGVSGPTWEKVY